VILAIVIMLKLGEPHTKLDRGHGPPCPDVEPPLASFG